MKKAMLAGLVAFVGVAAWAPVASADPPKKSQDYEYKFTDDKLLGDSMGASGAKITVLKTGRRDRLLRPRIQFVQEMLKSVENM
jgi:hypothetical protein